jgi:hypothetical protein
MTQDTGRRRSSIAVAASVVLALVGAVVLFLAPGTAGGPPQPPPAAAQVPSSPATGGVSASSGAADSAKEADLGPILTQSHPVGIDIPSLGVHTKNFVDLGQAANGSLEVPTDYSAVGWYTEGASPGALGPAVLVGHVDSHKGPAVFYRLGALKQGAKVTVTRRDGSAATFKVDGIRRFSKDHFPTNLIYGATDRAELRLITCGGSFDPKTGHYLDNVIAFAHLI